MRLPIISTRDANKAHRNLITTYRSSIVLPAALSVLMYTCDENYKIWAVVIAVNETSSRCKQQLCYTLKWLQQLRRMFDVLLFCWRHSLLFESVKLAPRIKIMMFWTMHSEANWLNNINTSNCVLMLISYLAYDGKWLVITWSWRWSSNI